MATEKTSHVCINGEDVEDQQEEKKMEQFFALIRNFQEARNRRKNELRQREEITKKQKKMRRLDDDEQSSWVPTFEWADFTQEIEFRRPPIIFPSPCYNKNDHDKNRKEEDDGLDLNLTLSQS
ncbi:hypothetical protein REPUB_Repub12eG0139100 [Reevesia pubescens]